MHFEPLWYVLGVYFVHDLGTTAQRTEGNWYKQPRKVQTLALQPNSYALIYFGSRACFRQPSSFSKSLKLLEFSSVLISGLRMSEFFLQFSQVNCP